MNEAERAAYCTGYEAGRIAEMQNRQTIAGTLAALATVPRTRRPLPAARRCGCGHADTTHNELGYCQARGRAGSDGCHCESFDNGLRRSGM